MGYSHCVYVGALMKVTTKPVDELVSYWMCENLHEFGKTYYDQRYQFCPTCGKPVSARDVKETRYPTEYDLIPDKWVDRLQSHHEFSGLPDNELIFFSNEGAGRFEHYSRDENGYREITPDNTIAPVETFKTKYADIIDHLIGRQDVKSVAVFFGVHAYTF